MIIGHVINGFPPAVIGGREMFVYHLADNLSKNNMDMEYHVITSHHKNLMLNEKINNFVIANWMCDIERNVKTMFCTLRVDYVV